MLGPRSRLYTHAAICVLAASWAAVAAAGGGSCRPPGAVARALLEGAGNWGSLEMESSYSLDDGLLDEGILRANLQARLSGSALRQLQSLRPTSATGRTKRSPRASRNATPATSRSRHRR